MPNDTLYRTSFIYTQLKEMSNTALSCTTSSTPCNVLRTDIIHRRTSLVPRPQNRAWYTHCLCICVITSAKVFVNRRPPCGKCKVNSIKRFQTLSMSQVNNQPLLSLVLAGDIHKRLVVDLVEAQTVCTSLAGQCERGWPAILSVYQAIFQPGDEATTEYESLVYN